MSRFPSIVLVPFRMAPLYRPRLYHHPETKATSSAATLTRPIDSNSSTDPAPRLIRPTAGSCVSTFDSDDCDNCTASCCRYCRNRRVHPEGADRIGVVVIVVVDSRCGWCCCFCSCSSGSGGGGDLQLVEIICSRRRQQRQLL